MIPVSTLYYEYIGRPKLPERKKNPFEYIVPPHKCIGTMMPTSQSDFTSLIKKSQMCTRYFSLKRASFFSIQSVKVFLTYQPFVPTLQIDLGFLNFITALLFKPSLADCFSRDTKVV